MWRSHANIPGLVRLLKAYFARHAHFRQELQQNLAEILARLQFVLMNRKAELSAFELLSAMFGYLPLDFFPTAGAAGAAVDTSLPQIFRVVLSTLMQRKDDPRVKKAFTYSLSVFVFRHGAIILNDTTNQVQTGLLGNLFDKIILDSFDHMKTVPEKKICSLGLVKLLSTPGLEGYGQRSLEKLALLLGLVAAGRAGAKARQGEMAAEVSAAGELFMDMDGSAGEYTGSFSKLANADALDGGDYARDVADWKTVCKQELQPHKASIASMGGGGNDALKALAGFLG